MPQIRRTARSEIDAIDIWMRIAEDNAEAADRTLHRIDERLRAIARMPESADAAPEFGKHVRRSFVGEYVLYFRPIENGIELLRILHGRRSLEGLDSN